MEVKAQLNHLRLAPRKLRLLADLVRGKKISQDKNQLRFLRKAGARPLAKLLDSAVANAKNNFQLDENNLFLAQIFVDEGPKLKRWRPMSRGRAYHIQKKTSHITMILSEIQAGPAKKKTEEKTLTAKEPSVKPIGPKPEKPKFKEEKAIGPKNSPLAKRFFRRKSI